VGLAAVAKVKKGAMRADDSSTLDRDDEGLNCHAGSSTRCSAHVQDWRVLHEAELLFAWDLAQARLPLLRIEPLE
jgi:hypothetical protein